MALTTAQLANGLTSDHELFFSSQPENREMRESTSIWLIEENGEFAFPRIGIEGEAWSWDNRLYHANFAVGGGRILREANRGPVPSPIGPEGKPTIFGAGPLSFRCIEPFRRWIVKYDGHPMDGTLAQQSSGTLDPGKTSALSFEVELEMETPGWVHDYPAEKVAKMSPTEAFDATSMGIGWRIEHLFRATGRLRLDGQDRDFKALGSRIKRQSVRTPAACYGHCWQSALFPDGSAFGFIAYPPSPKNPRPFNDGYLYKDGKFHRACATKAPWLRSFIDDGEDVSLELVSDLGITQIRGTTTLSTFHLPEYKDFNVFLQQGAVRYQWGDQTSYGMIERSVLAEQWAGPNAMTAES